MCYIEIYLQYVLSNLLVQGVVSAVVEQSRHKANMVAQEDRNFSP